MNREHLQKRVRELEWEVHQYVRFRGFSLDMDTLLEKVQAVMTAREKLAAFIADNPISIADEVPAPVQPNRKPFRHPATNNGIGH
jgi:hypothetical protein